MHSYVALLMCWVSASKTPSVEEGYILDGLDGSGPERPLRYLKGSQHCSKGTPGNIPLVSEVL